MNYKLEFSPDVEGYLKVLARRNQATLLDAIEKQLAYQPTNETRNRKPMRPNPIAPWELRVGSMRVYYDVQETPKKIVYIIAVGIKKRNQVWIGKELFRL